MPRQRLSRARVFAWMKIQGRPIKAREIAEAFQSSLVAASDMLGRMREIGAIIKMGNTHRATWRIVNPNVDMSSKLGMHANSLRNLRVKWRKTTGKGHARTKIEKRDDWPQSTGLETCWKLLPQSNQPIDTMTE
jgi:hypothetical protein